MRLMICSINYYVLWCQTYDYYLEAFTYFNSKQLKTNDAGCIKKLVLIKELRE